MKNLLRRAATFARNLGRDVVKLKLPVTAGAFVATLAAYLEPLGVELGGETTAKVTGVLVLVGVVYEYVRTRAEL